MDTAGELFDDSHYELGPAARLRVAVPAVASRVAAELRRQLITGKWVPGMRLNEPTIAEELGVSRNTLREAFAELGAERLVVRLPNRGVFVAAPGADDLRDFYTVRRAIEVSAVRNGGSAVRIAAIQEAVADGRKAAKAKDKELLADANLRFHGAIVEMAESQRLNTLMNQVLAEMRLFFFKEPVNVEFYSRYVEDNEEIAKALTDGRFDEAASLLKAYLDRSEQHLFEIYDAS
ncbi:transcriptional regulator, GntR family [Arthrobacter sp. cf158]|uniref:GntR family transcriptional regulator n=1 Tax=Arthrobacter sp. cf158 TaxID=1761744 RepID=UPI000894E9CA|nr:GntR family transcriptional regulator [Arthrobacter sp. cf158]SDX49462.1 transcriptional regulator, GntR family [Arthrobacter sp. cf158]